MPSTRPILRRDGRASLFLPDLPTMNILLRHSRALVFAALAAFTGAAAPAVRAHEDKMPAQEHGTMQPATAAAAWASINGLRGELAAQIAAKNLKPVHETAEQLTAALQALPAASLELGPDKLKRVQGAVANLAKALDAAHDAADENNRSESTRLNSSHRH